MRWLLLPFATALWAQMLSAQSDTPPTTPSFKSALSCADCAKSPPAYYRRIALAKEIVSQVKPYWDAPDGPESRLLRTFVRFELKEDGSLLAEPVMVSQSGITDQNRQLAKIHAERAIRAVRVAAPFKLPLTDYVLWRKVMLSFDRKF